MKRTPARLLGIGIAAAIAAAGPVSRAQISNHPAAAFLVFPYVVAEESAPQVETFLTITNTSLQPRIAHLAFINGDESDSRYCYDCDFDIPMVGLDTELLVIRRSSGITFIVNLDTGASRTCTQKIGFVTVNVEDSKHNVLTDNVLIGEQVTLDYTAGTSVAFDAIAIQGGAGNGDRHFQFDGIEYKRFPDFVMGGFIAPDFAGPLDAELVLLTLGFERQLPPLVDCAVSGVDAFGSAFTTGLQFGCWSRRSLPIVDPEFAYPYLGWFFDEQQHGWMKLRCTTFGTGDNAAAATGGVLGFIVHRAAPGSVLRREPLGPAVSGSAAWGTTMSTSTVLGDPIVLTLRTGGEFLRTTSKKERTP